MGRPPNRGTRRGFWTSAFKLFHRFFLQAYGRGAGSPDRCAMSSSSIPRCGDRLHVWY